ncbi:unnamed protein product [Effrenium voratum]|nr:unnamed protein product [Effrenium voratum]
MMQFLGHIDVALARLDEIRSLRVDESMLSFLGSSCLSRRKLERCQRHCPEQRDDKKAKCRPALHNAPCRASAALSCRASLDMALQKLSKASLDPAQRAEALSASVWGPRLRLEAFDLSSPLPELSLQALQRGLLVATFFQGSLGLLRICLGDFFSGSYTLLLATLGYNSRHPGPASAWLKTYVLISFINGTMGHIDLVQNLLLHNFPSIQLSLPLSVNLMHTVQLLVPGVSYCGAYFGWQHLKTQRKLMVEAYQRELMTMLEHPPWPPPPLIPLPGMPPGMQGATRLSHPGMGIDAAKLAREIATLGAGAWAERNWMDQLQLGRIFSGQASLLQLLEDLDSEKQVVAGELAEDVRHAQVRQEVEELSAQLGVLEATAARRAQRCAAAKAEIRRLGEALGEVDDLHAQAAGLEKANQLLDRQRAEWKRSQTLMLRLAEDLQKHPPKECSLGLVQLKAHKCDSSSPQWKQRVQRDVPQCASGCLNQRICTKQCLSRLGFGACADCLLALALDRRDTCRLGIPPPEIRAPQVPIPGISVPQQLYIPAFVR